jgi:hypothetical protein
MRINVEKCNNIELLKKEIYRLQAVIAALLERETYEDDEDEETTK